ncbi:MAG TPA: PPC domain-containing protein [Gemmataceae bacterium]|nr:PPC domain-containing protein [Gemmataceae bacterium]
MRVPPPFFCCAIGLVAWGLLPRPVAAAPPTLTYLFPAGAQQGKTVEVTAGGTFERWPVQAWAAHKGVEIKPAKDKGKFTITVSADAAPGTCWVRLSDEQGASALRPFIVGTLPEVMEQEPNDDPKKPQVLPSSSVVVNGRLDKAGDVDCFAVKLAKDETLVASLEANRTLGSPMDGVLQLLSADGFVLEENNDDHGLDPQLIFTAPKDGSYVVRVFAFPADPDASIRFAGGETYIYRLTLTTGGFADHAFPLAVSRTDPEQVEVIGWNVPEAAKKLTVKPDAGSDVVTLWHPRLANTVSVLVEPHRCVVGAKPNDRKRPQPIALPVTISAGIDPPGEIDTYEFAAKKGQRLVFRADARSIGSQLDPLLRLTDAAGKSLAQADDATAGKVGTRDAELAFAVPQDGNYRIEVRDLAGHGSFRHFYRLRAVLAEPDYVLVVAADRFTVAAGKPLDVPVTVERRNGFEREVEIAVEGLPAGVTATAKTLGKSVSLRLEAKGPASSAFRIVGTVAGRADLTRIATAPSAAFPPATPHLWLTVTK